jgi:chemotaxis response regulator CheB
MLRSVTVQRGPLPIRVLLADDSDVIRAAIERHLKTESKIELVGQTKRFDEAVKMVHELAPDVILLDLRMTTALNADDEGIRQVCSCWTVAMSVTVDDETDALYGKLNADAFIDKMYLHAKLIPVILELAGRDS